MAGFEKMKLAIAPLTWSNDDLPELGGETSFEQCISEMALAGYQGCEVGVKFPRDPKVLKPELDLRKLQVCNQWFSFNFTHQSFDEVKKDFLTHLDFLEGLGASVVNGAEIGSSIQGKMELGLSHKPSFSEDDWKTMTDSFNKIGQVAQDRGFVFCYHHHMGTCVQTEAEVDRFLEMTDDRYVALNYDSGHFYFSKEDPIALLKKYLPRVRHIHLKDVRDEVLNQVLADDASFLNSVLSGVFAVTGDGSLDFPAIFQVLKGNYEGWLVVEAEQDPAKAHPLATAIRSREYIRTHTGL